MLSPSLIVFKEIHLSSVLYKTLLTLIHLASLQGRGIALQAQTVQKRQDCNPQSRVLGTKSLNLILRICSYNVTNSFMYKIFSSVHCAHNDISRTGLQCHIPKVAKWPSQKGLVDQRCLLDTRESSYFLTEMVS